MWIALCEIAFFPHFLMKYIRVNRLGKIVMRSCRALIYVIYINYSCDPVNSAFHIFSVKNGSRRIIFFIRSLEPFK